MINHYISMFKIITQYLVVISDLMSTIVKDSEEKDLENQFLREQLSVFQQEVINEKIPSPKIPLESKQRFVILSKVLRNWEKHLVLVKPETLIGWHKSAFKYYWGKKSKKNRRGRPKISEETIDLIKKIHIENKLLSPRKIREQLIEQNVTDAPSPKTIRKYITGPKKKTSNAQTQSWRTFLKNHMHNTWSMDFCTIPTLFFKILYVFVIVSHDRRKIVHFGITTSPSAIWIVQRLREATPYGEVPKYLMHDNDPVFRSKLVQGFLKSSNISSKRTGYRSPWQNPFAERTIGTIRSELLNHVVPLNESHLHKLMKEYVEYYNENRTHQGIDCRTPVFKEKPIETLSKNTVLQSTPVLNGLYHSYKKVV